MQSCLIGWRAVAADSSRRRLLGALTGLGLGGVLALRDGDDAAAEKPGDRLRRRKQQHRRKRRNSKRRNNGKNGGNHKNNGGGLGSSECGATGNDCNQDSDCCTGNCFNFACAETVRQCSAGGTTVPCRPAAKGCAGSQCCHGALSCNDGCCSADANQCNAGGNCCVPNCAGKACGPDGCGVALENVELTMTGCTVTGNTNHEGGPAGISTMGGTLDLKHCTITDNRVDSESGGVRGGGIGIDDTEVTLTNCLVADNTAISTHPATTFGGGIFVAGGGKLTLSNTEVTRNFTNGVGGGIYVDDDSTATLEAGAAVTLNDPTNCAGKPMVGCMG